MSDQLSVTPNNTDSDFPYDTLGLLLSDLNNGILPEEDMMSLNKGLAAALVKARSNYNSKKCPDYYVNSTYNYLTDQDKRRLRKILVNEDCSGFLAKQEDQLLSPETLRKLERRSQISETFRKYGAKLLCSSTITGCCLSLAGVPLFLALEAFSIPQSHVWFKNPTFLCGASGALILTIGIIGRGIAYLAQKGIERGSTDKVAHHKYLEEKIDDECRDILADHLIGLKAFPRQNLHKTRQPRLAFV